MKKRLAATAIALVVGAGAVHATGMQGGSLSGWYEGAFQKERERIAGFAGEEMTRLLAGIGAFALEAGEWAEEQIVSLTETEEERAKRELEAREAEIRSQLESTAARLEEDLKDGITDHEQLEAEIESDVTRLLEEILNEH
ncbi:hypothetical protein [Bhargavaea cecembensis]|uniref:hypothetical protein n=1 Tax=Bhargavaea cecembensis TaxID=394098 RepID=UPI00058BA4F3|nr:hypothetical protein [Bhargavaea cecembensis]